MKNLGLVGHPVAHSVSPAFQQAALDALGVDARYQPIDTTSDALPAVIDRLRQDDWLGVNVTVPHKEAVFRLVDEIDDVAQAVGAVNTVVNRGGRLFATNTDVVGFMRSLESSGAHVDHQQCLVLGAGGAARSVVYGLARAGALVVLANRNQARGVALLDWLSHSVPGARLQAVSWDDVTLTSAASDSRLIVNTTTLGMLHGPDEAQSPLLPAAFRPGQFVCDLVYNPPETPFLRLAGAAGSTPIGGLEMLIQQGAASFELWTGQAAPVDTMRRAAQIALYGAPR